MSLPGTTGGVERQGAFQAIFIAILLLMVGALLTADHWGGTSASAYEGRWFTVYTGAFKADNAN